MAKQYESAVDRWKKPSGELSQERIAEEESARRSRMIAVSVVIGVVVLAFVGLVMYSSGSRRKGAPDAGIAERMGRKPAPVAETAAAPVPTDPEEIKALLSNPENPVIRIHTTKGDILAELFEDRVPNTVANMIQLAEEGFYKGMSFHRIIPGFMAQGGCPHSKRGASGQPGTGDPGYRFADEFGEGLEHSGRGILSMANSGPDTNGSQFFICFKATPHLDGKHSVFGKVVAGMDVLDRLERIGSSSGQPSETVRFDIDVVQKRDHPYEVETLN